MYKPSVCTCGKREKRKDACINQASVPAESGRSGKAHVQTKRLYLRKVGEAESACTNRALIPAKIWMPESMGTI